MSSTVEPSTAGNQPAADRVIRELDVYVCNGVLGQGTQMYLLQCPLRPPWRPYHEEGLEKVRLKPRVKKLAAEAKLVMEERNYNPNVEPIRAIKALSLQSSRVEMRAALAGGYVEDDRLLLFPIDEALQLRPNMSYLDKEKEEKKRAAAEEAAAAEEGKVQQELMPLTVQVKRRETELQQAARLRSYAYLQQQEEQDAWVPLRYHGEDSEMAAKVWHQLSNTEALDVRHTMTRQQYLNAIMPGAASLDQPPQEMDFGGNAGLIDLGVPSSYATRRAMEEAARSRRGDSAAAAGQAGPSGAFFAGSIGSGAAMSGAAAGAAAAAHAGGDGGGAAAAAARAGGRGGGWSEPLESLPDEVVAALPAVVAVALKYSPVLSLEQIRRYILNLPESPAKPAAQASDASLHAALLAGGGLVCIRKCYMHKTLGNPTLDPLRGVVLELLADQEQLKRSEIMEAAKAKGIQVSDTLYAKVVKEICQSRGGTWSLKSPM